MSAELPSCPSPAFATGSAASVVTIVRMSSHVLRELAVTRWTIMDFVVFERPVAIENGPLKELRSLPPAELVFALSTAPRTLETCYRPRVLLNSYGPIAFFTSPFCRLCALWTTVLQDDHFARHATSPERPDRSPPILRAPQKCEVPAAILWVRRKRARLLTSPVVQSARLYISACKRSSTGHCRLVVTRRPQRPPRLTFVQCAPEAPALALGAILH
jgi:hypothetical protein